MPLTVARLTSVEGKWLQLANGCLLLNLGFYILIEARHKCRSSTNVADLPNQYADENRQIMYYLVWVLMNFFFVRQHSLGPQRRWEWSLSVIYYLTLSGILVLIVAIGAAIASQCGNVNYGTPDQLNLEAPTGEKIAVERSGIRLQ